MVHAFTSREGEPQAGSCKADKDIKYRRINRIVNETKVGLGAWIALDLDDAILGADIGSLRPRGHKGVTLGDRDSAIGFLLGLTPSPKKCRP